MYRKSSKGNPYHDSLGRFTSAGGKGTKGKRGGDSAPVLWSSFGEQEEVKGMSVKQMEKIDVDKTDTAMTDGRRFYHKQSISREKYARSLSQFTIPAGLSVAEKRKFVDKAITKFEKENKYALKNGGKLVAYRKGNSNSISYQVVESERMKNDIYTSKGVKKRTSVTRNTSTSMKQFSGYTVDFTKNNLVRSCSKDASPAEVKQHVAKFCEKYKSKLSDKDVCIKLWTDKEGRVRYSASFRFDDNKKAEAEKFAKEVGGIVISHDDGSQA